MTRLTRSLIIILLSPVYGWSSDYHIGPGQTYTTIGAAPWSSLVAGDTAYIHAKPDQAPYYERLYISSALQGTDGNPIRIIGVDDALGNAPILDGNNSTTGTNFDTYGDPQYHSILGLLFIGPGDTAGYGVPPRYIEISNIVIRNTVGVNTTDENSVLWSSRSFSAVYIQGGEHITLDGVEISGGTDGIFAKDQPNAPVKWITVKNSYIHSNGVVGNYLYHNVYTEGYYLTFEGSYFGPPITGSPGANIKDRGVGTIIRYNYLHQGAHILDLVECQDSCVAHTADPTWNETYVYGNTFYADNSSTLPGAMIHFGTGDNGANPSYWRDTLYFYNNTVVIERDRDLSYQVTYFRISSNDQTVYADNNIFYTVAATTGESAPFTSFTYDSDNGSVGNFVFGPNWVSPGWTLNRTGYTWNGTDTGTANIISPIDNDPSFVDASAKDFRLSPSSAAIGASGALPVIISTGNAHGMNLTPLKQYSEQSTMDRADVNDIGAYRFDGLIRYKLGGSHVSEIQDGVGE